MSESELDELLAFFKALAPESRLRIVGALSADEAGVGELAKLVGLSAPTVSHHLGVLRDAGVVRMRAEGTVRIYSLDITAIQARARVLLADEAARGLEAELDADSFAAAVLRSFVDEERITAIPASRRKRRVILEWLAQHVPRGRAFPEPEFSRLIQQYHPEDPATLRRELVGAGLVDRQRGAYTRAEA